MLVFHVEVVSLVLKFPSSFSLIADARADLAYQIALNYGHLIGEKDGDGMTGLQLLSCSPSVFKQEPEDGFIKLGMEV